MKKGILSWKSLMIAGAFTVSAVAGAGTALAKDTYNATFYVAGMGGHFAKAVATIDPSQDQPIKLKALTKVDIGDRATHPVHDARIDVNNRTKMFWSTYKIDKATGKTHVGVSDLTTGEKIKDVDVSVPAEATKTGSMYCASAQSWDHFMPISMSNKGYIDVFQKSDLKQTQRIFLEGTEADIKKPYKYYHGTNSPDMKKMLMVVNEAATDHGDILGKVHFLQLDMEQFVQGKVKVINKTVAAGSEKVTISFRQYYSTDGKMIANATGDRLIMLDGNSLEITDQEILHRHDQNHDAIFTPDNKYVVLTLRTKRVNEDCKDPDNPSKDEFLMDGTLQLYDVAAKKVIGQRTSVCLACHDQEGLSEHAVLCGLDANWSDI